MAKGFLAHPEGLRVHDRARRSFKLEIRWFHDMTGHPDDGDDAASIYLRRLQGPGVEAGGQQSEAVDHAVSDGRATGEVRGARPGRAGGLFRSSGPPSSAPTGDSSAALPRSQSRHTESGGSPFIQPGSLPARFGSEGLKMLRAGEYNAATRYYRAITDRHPDDAHGWLGLGAALLGKGDLKTAATCFTRGRELDPSFPVGALAAEARPGNPEGLFKLASACMQMRHGIAYGCAMVILDECLASPLTSPGLYLKVDELRRKARLAVEDWQGLSNPAIVSMKRNARRERLLSSVMRTWLTIGLVLVVAFLGYTLVQRARAETVLKIGTDAYVEASRLARHGQSKRNTSGVVDGLALLGSAYDKLKQAADLYPTSFDAQFMLLRSSEAMLKSPTYRATNASMPANWNELDADVTRLREVIQRLDPDGHKSARKDKELKGLIDAAG